MFFLRGSGEVVETVDIHFNFSCPGNDIPFGFSDGQDLLRSADSSCWLWVITQAGH